ncbi:MAG: polysaccharide deacetylase family protein [Hyphomicrobiales bacterium]
MKELIAELDRCAEAGQRITFWLRDDDAVAVTPALERLLALAGDWDVPVVMAVIPMPAEPALAVHLGELAHVRVALHGFAHRNHAPPEDKKQELGPHRPAATVLDELRRGRDRLNELFSHQSVPMLVPPWNRIAADLVPHLPGLGLHTLSTFGEVPTKLPARLLQVNCQLDIMDWHKRRGHPADVLAGRLATVVRSGTDPIGILTHHLDHDEGAWGFLTQLFRLTARHDAVTWGWPVEDFSQ